MTLQKLCSTTLLSATLLLGTGCISSCNHPFNWSNYDKKKTSTETETKKSEQSEKSEKKENILKELPESLEHEYQIELVGFNELSGICLSKDGTIMYGVDDQGKLFEIQIEKIISEIDNGTIKLETKNRKILKTEYKNCTINNKDDSYFIRRAKKTGMEGLAIDHDENLYIALEEKSKCVYMIEHNENGYDFEHGKEMVSFPNKSKYGNDGVEGIAYYQKGDEKGLYLGVQTESQLYYYSFADELLKDPIKLSEAEGMDEEKKANGKKIGEIAGLEYEEENDRLWVIDSENFRIYVFNGIGTQLIKSYDLSDLIEDNTSKEKMLDNNPEGLCIDIERNCIWVCEDIDDNSILHKYDFKF